MSEFKFYSWIRKITSFAIKNTLLWSDSEFKKKISARQISANLIKPDNDELPGLLDFVMLDEIMYSSEED